MTELFKISSARGEIRTQVVFVHGLSGHYRKTWLAADSDACWLPWLAADLSGVAVWSVDYDASISRWAGSATHLMDRGATVMRRLVAEQDLAQGEIALVGHSLGGLVIKQALRTAQEVAPDDTRVASFIARVRKVAFLATPHTGSNHANLAALLRLLVRPSPATASLLKDDPNLRALNLWYRDWARRERVENLVLVESQGQGWQGLLGQIVKLDSADPGLQTRPILLDATHTSICKPASRSSETYIHLKDFIESVSESQGSNQFLLKQLGERIDSAGARTAEIVSGDLAEVIRGALATSTSTHLPTDEYIRSKLTQLRQARLIPGFTVAEAATRLANSLETGDLSGGSQSVRGVALGWCARLLVNDAEASSNLIRLALRLTDDPDVEIAEAFVLAASGQIESALSNLAKLGSPAARTASLMILRNHRGDDSALRWLADAGVEPAMLDSDGKYAYLTILIASEQWDDFTEFGRSVEERDFEATPSLLNIVALSHLIRAVPSQLRSQVLQGVPFEAKRFPLRLSQPDLEEIRLAKALFTRFSVAAEQLGCDDAKLAAEDYALWLTLRDPAYESIGIAALKDSLRKPEHSLRRIHLAIPFGIKVDLSAVDAEITRRETLFGKTTVDTALARLAIAFSQDSPGGVASYIEEHRPSLVSYFGDHLVSSIQIDLFAQSGNLDRARELMDGLEDSGGTKPPLELVPLSKAERIETLIEKYRKSKQLVDLMDLVHALKVGRDKRLGEYAAILFEETQGVLDAEVLAQAYHEANKDSEIIDLAQRFPHFLDVSNRLLELHGWSLYRSGRLNDAAEVALKLRAKRDDPNDRALSANIAISSGSWGALLPIVENEWQSRESRNADELMIAATLGAATKSPRTRDLVLAAVGSAPNDANILFGAYVMATRMGWEANSDVTTWLHRAAELSGAQGPVKRVSLKEIVDSGPGWNKTQADVATSLDRGEIPLFVAARVLRRTLVDLFLMPALLNQTRNDVRRTSVVPAFSGARRAKGTAYNRVVFDPTALLTLGMLGMLERLEGTVDSLLLPHATMAWLFEEKQKIEFHQPSRIADAKLIQASLTSGAIKEFRPTTVADQGLASDVGDELASMLKDATSSSDGMRFVIKGSPVYRVSSFMEEEVDLDEYHAVLRSCMSVVSKLSKSGELTTAEQEHAFAYLRSQEAQWPSEDEIPDGATLYLDDVSLSYLRHLSLLEKVSSAGLHVLVSSDAIQEVSELLQYEHQASTASKVIEYIRGFVEHGVKAGTITVGTATSDRDESIIGKHPIVEAIKFAASSDVVVSDDRFVNQKSEIEEQGHSAHVASTIDVLEEMRLRGKISQMEWYESMTKLRRAKYICVPLSPDELSHHLSAAKVEDGRLIESGELRAIRENVLRLQMTDMLQIDRDLPWLIQTLQTMISIIRDQWVSAPTIEIAVARANWLLPQCDIRGWSHRFPRETAEAITTKAYASLILLLAMTPDDIASDRKEKYEEWVDDTIFRPLKTQHGGQFDLILQSARGLIRSIALD